MIKYPIFGKKPVPQDPVVVEASRLLAEHSQRLMDQAHAFARNQYGLGTEERDTPDYTSFVQARKGSLIQKLLEDTHFQELREEASRLGGTRNISEEVQ